MTPKRRAKDRFPSILENGFHDPENFSIDPVATVALIRTRTKRELCSEQWAFQQCADVSCRFLDRRADAAARQAEKKRRRK